MEGKVNIEKKKRNLVPDIDNSIKLLKCNLKPAKDLSTLFPYTRFQHYLGCLNEIQKLKRRKSILSGESIPHLLEFYNDDEYLKQELFNIYGDLDENSLYFKKLFNNYKEERLEEIEEWIEYEIYYNNETQKKTSSSVNASNEEEEIKIPNLKDEFTLEELELFESMKTPDSGFEWFNLPRKNLNKEEIGKLKKNSCNLALFDPELSNHPFDSRIIPPQEERGLSEKLSLNIYELICRHPEGIIYEDFLVEYRKKFLYTPDLYGLGYKTPYEFLYDLNHVVYTQNNGPRNELVLFPTYLENLICTPIEMLWRIYHKVIIFLHFFDGVAKTNDLIQYFENLYHLKLPLKSWGFQNADEFVCFLIQHEKWRNEEYVVEKASVFKHNLDGHYVIYMTKQRQHALEEKKKTDMLSKSMQHDCRVVPHTSFISKLYVQPGDQISSESDIVYENKEEVCIVVHLQSLCEFSIVRKCQWDLDAGRKWSKMYKDLLKIPEKKHEMTMNTHNLKPGCLLVIYHKKIDEYVRAKYIKVAEKFHHFWVELIDGDHDDDEHLSVHQNQMFYLQKSWMNEYKALSIRAKIWNIQFPPNAKGTKSYEAIFDHVEKTVCISKGVRVRFLSYSNTNGGVWLISMKVGPNKQDPDIGLVLTNYCKKFGLPNCVKNGGIGSHQVSSPSRRRIMDIEETKPLSTDSSEIEKTESDNSGYGDGPKENTTNGTNDQGLEQITSSSEAPVTSSTQKKPSYQPKSYADTAASSTWRSAPNHSRNFASESNAFPTLAESVNAKQPAARRQNQPGAQTQFSYANAANRK